MAKLVYLPTLEKSSWLHWGRSGQSSCLRDYCFTPCQEIREHSTNDILQMLLHPDAQLSRAAPVDNSKDAFWRAEIRRMNISSGFQAADNQRLLAYFSDHILSLADGEWNESKKRSLRFALNRWADWLASIRDKLILEFNHWDAKTCEKGKVNLRHGEGLSWAMLEYCRRPDDDGHPRLHYIETERREFDFAVIGREVNLSLSIKKNPIQRKANRVEPDAIAVRRNGRFCVVEIKGPQDDGNLLKATVQAFFGLLAVYAKREMIQEIARTAARLRPACPEALIPKGVSCDLGIYVIVDSQKWSLGKNHAQEQKAYQFGEFLLDTWGQLGFIAFIRLADPKCLTPLRDEQKLRFKKVITRPTTGHPGEARHP